MRATCLGMYITSQHGNRWSVPYLSRDRWMRCSWHAMRSSIHGTVRMRLFRPRGEIGGVNGVKCFSSWNSSTACSWIYCCCRLQSCFIAVVLFCLIRRSTSGPTVAPLFLPSPLSLFFSCLGSNQGPLYSTIMSLLTATAISTPTSKRYCTFSEK